MCPPLAQELSPTPSPSSHTGARPRWSLGQLSWTCPIPTRPCPVCTQAELADQVAWAAQPRNVAHQRMQQHNQDENTARYFMQFTSEVLHMIEYLTAEKEVRRRGQDGRGGSGWVGGLGVCRLRGRVGREALAHVSVLLWAASPS